MTAATSDNFTCILGDRRGADTAVPETVTLDVSSSVTLELGAQEMWAALVALQAAGFLTPPAVARALAQQLGAGSVEGAYPLLADNPRRFQVRLDGDALSAVLNGLETLDRKTPRRAGYDPLPRPLPQAEVRRELRQRCQSVRRPRILL